MQSLCGAQLYRQVSAYCWLGSFMVGDKTNKKQDKKNNSVELEASLAPAEAEVGAVAKADQKQVLFIIVF